MLPGGFKTIHVYEACQENRRNSCLLKQKKLPAQESF